MRFIDPRTDFAFKKIFGSQEHTDVLRSLLNGLLYEGRPEIRQLRLLDPYNAPRLQGMKDSYLDVKVRRADGTWILVEMQVLKLPGFDKRVLFNAAKQFGNQLQRGEDYSMVNPVVALTITDFVMFPEYPDVISRYRLLEKNLLTQYSAGDIELVFAELPKLTKTHAEATQLWEKWLCFLKEAGSLEMVPDSLAEVPEIREAFEIANYAGLTQEEADVADKKMQWWRDQKKLGALYDKEKAAHEHTRAKLDQANAEREKVEAERDKTLRNTALALRESGMDDARVCAVMGVTQQELRGLLRAGLPREETG
ncbi:MAG: Rpn family recombination-promoting nuclease/putative transposase [Myxococcota bacterium]